jgi:hypothetical protein
MVSDEKLAVSFIEDPLYIMSLSFFLLSSRFFLCLWHLGLTRMCLRVDLTEFLLLVELRGCTFMFVINFGISSHYFFKYSFCSLISLFSF